MAPSFSSLILSDLFTFHVGIGEKKEAIQVHSTAVAATCDYMRALIEGGMKEAQEKCAKLDMEMEDFVRFVEFAYRRDYTIPAWELEIPDLVVEHAVKPGGPDLQDAVVEERLPPEEPPPADEPETAEEPVPADESWTVEEPVPAPAEEPVPIEESLPHRVLNNWQLANSPAYQKKKASKARAFRSRYQGQTFLPQGFPRAVILDGFEPEQNTGPEQNFTPVFQAYVRLYAFAEMRLIHDLGSLTLEKLSRTLQTFRIYPGRVGDIVELVRCTYENTPNRKDDGGVDKLRKLVVGYIACSYTAIGESADFMQLLEEGGEFVADFWRVLIENII